MRDNVLVMRQDENLLPKKLRIKIDSRLKLNKKTNFRFCTNYESEIGLFILCIRFN